MKLQQENETLLCHSSRTYQIVCGIPALAAEVAQRLDAVGWVVQLEHSPPDPCITLLIDGPWGTALLALEQGQPQQMVVVTDNPCPEYWDDLWSLQPLGLLAGGHAISALAEALERALAGKCFRQVPHHENSLTDVERQILRHAAQGRSSAQIGQRLGMKEPSVRNAVGRVLGKLGFERKGELMLYYLGHWAMLYDK